MSTSICFLDPNEIISGMWMVGGPNASHGALFAVADGVRQPALPDDTIIQTSTQGNSITFSMTSCSVEVVTTIRVWVFGSLHPAGDNKTEVMIGSGIIATIEQDILLSFVAAWRSVDFDVANWTQSQLDNLYVSFIFSGTGAGVSINAFYVEIFGTQAAGQCSFPITGRVIGSSGTGGAGDIFHVFDGNQSTFFRGTAANGQWVGIDMGTHHRVSEIRYSPSSEFPSRMLNGLFQVSNDLASWATVHTISSVPHVGVMTSVNISDTNQYRYVRYLSPDGGHGDISEMQIFGCTTSTVPSQFHIQNNANMEMLFF